jgi:hypothetical protein
VKCQKVNSELEPARGTNLKLKIKKTCLQSITNFSILFQLINLFSSDGQRIFDMVLFGPMIIGGPIVTVFGVFYILWLLGYWALLGMTPFLLFYPAQVRRDLYILYFQFNAFTSCHP